MFGWLKQDRVSRLQRRYLRTLRQARDAERTGDAVLAVILFDEAEEIAAELDALREEQGMVTC